MNRVFCLQLKCQSSRDNKQNQHSGLQAQSQHSIAMNSCKNIQSKTENSRSKDTLGPANLNLGGRRLKTANDESNGYTEQFLKSFYTPTYEFVKSHKPFLQNRKVIFNVKNRHRTVHGRNNSEDSCTLDNENNIERLKKQILDLDREDFISYRSKCQPGPNDNGKKTQDDKISKYNHQNSMIVEWQGHNQHKTLVRPSSTLGLSTHCRGRSYIGLSNHCSAPKKYFSKPKPKRQVSICSIGNPNEQSEAMLHTAKIKLKTEQIAIGLNLFRGKMHRRKIKSSYQILG